MLLIHEGLILRGGGAYKRGAYIPGDLYSGGLYSEVYGISIKADFDYTTFA